MFLLSVIYSKSFLFKTKEDQKEEKNNGVVYGQPQMLWGPDSADKWDKHLTTTTTTTTTTVYSKRQRLLLKGFKEKCKGKTATTAFLNYQNKFTINFCCRLIKIKSVYWILFSRLLTQLLTEVILYF